MAHFTRLLGTGAIVLLGSANDENPRKSSELFDPVSGQWICGTPTWPMPASITRPACCWMGQFSLPMGSTIRWTADQ